jgi:hypothetical protein
MSKSGKKDTAKSKAVHRASTSGVHRVTSRRVAPQKRTAQAQPPVPKPGTSQTIRSKSGRYILTSPAKSANSVSTWSRAFKET